MIRRYLALMTLALTLCAPLTATQAQAAWWTCSTWVTRSNGLAVGHVVCAGNPPSTAKYYANISSCRKGDGTFVTRRGVSVRIGSGGDSATYCPKGTSLHRNDIHVALRTRISEVTMPDIDVPAILEAAAAADCYRSYPYSMGHAAMVLPGIAEALYAPILALHQTTEWSGTWGEHADEECNHEGPCPIEVRNVCLSCVPENPEADYVSVPYPCPTRRTVEANLAAIRGQA